MLPALLFRFFNWHLLVPDSQWHHVNDCLSLINSFTLGKKKRGWASGGKSRAQGLKIQLWLSPCQWMGWWNIARSRQLIKNVSLEWNKLSAALIFIEIKPKPCSELHKVMGDILHGGKEGILEYPELEGIHKDYQSPCTGHLKNPTRSLWRKSWEKENDETTPVS